MRRLLDRGIWTPAAVALATVGTAVAATAGTQWASLSQSQANLSAPQACESSRFPLHQQRLEGACPGYRRPGSLAAQGRARGEERILAAWHTADGLKCVGWAEQDGGLPNIRSDASNQGGPSSFDFAHKLVPGPAHQGGSRRQRRRRLR